MVAWLKSRGWRWLPVTFAILGLWQYYESVMIGREWRTHHETARQHSIDTNTRMIELCDAAIEETSDNKKIQFMMKYLEIQTTMQMKQVHYFNESREIFDRKALAEALSTLFLSIATILPIVGKRIGRMIDSMRLHQDRNDNSNDEY